QDIGHSGAPSVLPDLLKHGHKPVDHQVALIRTNILHDVESYWIIHVERGEIEYIVYSLFRNIFKELFGCASVRINKAYSPAFLDILDSHVFKQGRFAHT